MTYQNFIIDPDNPSKAGWLITDKGKYYSDTLDKPFPVWRKVKPKKRFLKMRTEGTRWPK